MEQVQYDSELKQKRRIIAGTVAILVIVLGMLVWAVVAIISGPSGTTSKTEQVPVSEQTNPTADPQPDQKDTTADANAEDTQATSGSTSQQGSASNQDSATAGLAPITPAVTAESYPETGPADHLFTTLLIGAAVYLFAYNVSLVRRQTQRR